jgi:AraC-like DNA-binding protein
MDAILIIGIFEAFSLSLLLFFKKKRNVSDSILTGFFLVFGINILLSYIELYNRKNGYPFPAFINTTAPFILLHGPILWFYIQSQTKQKFQFKPIFLLHFIPFIGMLIDHTSQLYFLPVEEKIHIVTTEAFKDYFSYPLWVMVITISPLVYFLWGIKILNTYNSKIENFLSHTELFDFRWLKKLLIIIIILYCLVNFSFVIDFIVPLASFSVLQYIAFILASLFILIMGIFGQRQNNLFNSEVIKVDLDKLYEDKKISKLEKEERVFIVRLHEFMRTEKPYLEPEITVSGLSQQLNISVEYLSEMLNRRLNVNFFDYINQYRVEEFKKEVQKPESQHLTLTGIALNCGFNSKASFYRVFKKNTNTTPSLYKQKLSEK